MLTHEDAIEFFRASGIEASRRRWALGDSIVLFAYAHDGGDADTLRGHHGGAWLVPAAAGTWDLVQAVSGFERWRSFLLLDDAGAAALALVRAQKPTDVCPACGGARELGVSERPYRSGIRWSISTTCRGCGDHSVACGGDALPEDLRALELARHGGWRVSAPARQPLVVWQELRAHLGLDLAAVARLKRRLPGPLFEGTFAEARVVLDLVLEFGGAATLAPVEW